MTSKIGVRQAVFEKLRLIIFHCPEVVLGRAAARVVRARRLGRLGSLVGLAKAAPAVPGAQARGLVMLLAHEDVLVPALVSVLVSVLEQR